MVAVLITAQLSLEFHLLLAKALLSMHCRNMDVKGTECQRVWSLTGAAGRLETWRLDTSNFGAVIPLRQCSVGASATTLAVVTRLQRLCYFTMLVSPLMFLDTQMTRIDCNVENIRMT